MPSQAMHMTHPRMSHLTGDSCYASYAAAITLQTTGYTSLDNAAFSRTSCIDRLRLEHGIHLTSNSLAAAAEDRKDRQSCQAEGAPVRISLHIGCTPTQDAVLCVVLSVPTFCKFRSIIRLSSQLHFLCRKVTAQPMSQLLWRV